MNYFQYLITLLTKQSWTLEAIEKIFRFHFGRSFIKNRKASMEWSAYEDKAHMYAKTEESGEDYALQEYTKYEIRIIPFLKSLIKMTDIPLWLLSLQPTVSYSLRIVVDIGVPEKKWYVQTQRLQLKQQLVELIKKLSPLFSVRMNRSTWLGVLYTVYTWRRLKKLLAFLLMMKAFLMRSYSLAPYLCQINLLHKSSHYSCCLLYRSHLV